MKTRLTCALFFCVSITAGPGAETKADTARPAPAPVVKAGKLPDLKLPPAPPVAEERKAAIRQWIEQLAEVDGPGFGYSGTLSGSVFAPQPESAEAGTMLLTNHQLKTCEAVVKLVEAGADALPFLLEKLDDATPTKYTLTHGGSFGGMWLSTEMGANPVNPAEKTPERKRSFDYGANVTEYTLKRGDMCFVIIGQITARRYQAVRYQPTAIIYINSPVESKELCAAVRAVWQAPDARTRLFESLLFDYSTEGIFNGHSLDGWSLGSDIQTGAARRLAYYFAEETADLLARRIDALDLKPAPWSEDVQVWFRRDLANGLRAEDFLKALCGAKSAKVQKALLEAARRTDDPELFRAALPAAAKQEHEFVAGKIRKFIAALPRAEKEGPYGEGYELLSSLVRVEGEKAKPDIIAYLKKAGSQRRHSACAVFERGGPPWAVEILRPLLDDRSGSSWGKEYLVCDAAATSLASIREDLKFDGHASRKERDQAIKTMRAALLKEKP